MTSQQTKGFAQHRSSPDTHTLPQHCQVSVGVHPGTVLPSILVAAGSAASSGGGANAAAAARSDAVVGVTGNLVGNCTFADDSGAEVTQLCSSGMLTVATQYFEVGRGGHRCLTGPGVLVKKGGREISPCSSPGSLQTVTSPRVHLSHRASPGRIHVYCCPDGCQPWPPV